MDNVLPIIGTPRSSRDGGERALLDPEIAEDLLVDTKKRAGFETKNWTERRC